MFQVSDGTAAHVWWIVSYTWKGFPEPWQGKLSLSLELGKHAFFPLMQAGRAWCFPWGPQPPPSDCGEAFLRWRLLVWCLRASIISSASASLVHTWTLSPSGFLKKYSAHLRESGHHSPFHPPPSWSCSQSLCSLWSHMNGSQDVCPQELCHLPPSVKSQALCQD